MWSNTDIVPLGVQDRDEQGCARLHGNVALRLEDRAPVLSRCDDKRAAQAEQVWVWLLTVSVGSCIVEDWAGEGGDTVAPLPPHRHQLRLRQMLPGCVCGLGMGLLGRRRQGPHQRDSKA